MNGVMPETDDASTRVVESVECIMCHWNLNFPAAEEVAISRRITDTRSRAAAVLGGLLVWASSTT